MKKGILFSIIAMIGLASCQQKEDFTLPIEGEKMTFYASIADDATKTTAEVDGEKTKVLWTKDDAYSLSVKGGAFAKFTLDGEGGQTTGTFSGTAVEGEGTQNIAYYPYTEGVTLTDGKLSVVFPSVQAYSANSIAAAPMVAVSADKTLKFQNVASLIKITLQGDETIKSVSLTGNNDEILAGNALVTLEETPSLALAADAEEKTITLDCGEGIQLTTDGVDFYFAVPSITLTKGFTVVATDSEEKAMIKSTTKEVVLTASKVKVFPAFEYENNLTEVSTLDEINEAISNSKNIKLLNDITLTDILVIGKNIIFDGNGHTLTSSAGRAINVSGATDVTIKNLTINASGERAINIIQNAKKVTIDNVTATAANYTVNVASSAPEAVVVINNSTLTGLNVVNVASAGADVNVSGSTINCNDKSSAEAYGALFLNKDAVNGKIVATGCTINIPEGSKSMKGVNSAENGVITIDGSTEGVSIHVAYIGYGDNSYTFTSLKGAVEYAKSGETVALLRDIVLNEALVVENEKNFILDLNGKTISGANNKSSGHLIKVANGAVLTIDDSSSDKSGKITYAQGTSNVGWTIYLEGVLNLKAGIIELTGDWSIGYAVDVRPNAWGTAYTSPTTFNMNGGKLVSSDGAVRVASTSSDTYKEISANFNMNGGEIDAVADGVFIQQSNAVHDNLNVVINNGKVSSDKYPIRLYGPAPTSFVGTDSKPTKLTINGGEFHLDKEMLSEKIWLIDNLLVAGGGADANWPQYAEININSGEYSDLKTVKYLGSNANVMIKLAEDVEDAESITIPAGATVTLDLNNHNLTGSYTGSDHYAMFTIPNGAAMTVTGDGNVSAETNVTADNRSLALFQNAGDLTLKSGTYNISNTRNGHTWIIATIVDNRTNSASCVTKLTIDGGTYSVSGDATNLFRNYPQQGGSATLIINGGLFKSKNGATTYIWNQESKSYLGELYFNGGTYETGVVYEDYNGQSDVHIADGVNIQGYSGNN